MTWRNIFDLTKNMWDITQSDIANYLNVDRSTISRLINGKQLNFKMSLNDIYKKIFDPSNPDGPAYSTNPNAAKQLLHDLNNALEELYLTESVKNMDKKTYETFVLQMLKSIKKTPSQCLPKHESIPYNESNDVDESRQINNGQPEKISYDFYRSANGFAIEDFIGRNPVDSLSADRIHDTITFIGHIRTRQAQADASDKSSNLYQNIAKFIDGLLEYIIFLKKNSANPKAFPEYFTPIVTIHGLNKV